MSADETANCGHASQFSNRTECARCRDRREARETRVRAATEVEFYRRSGHCGGCGQPAGWCQCTERQPCGCRELHRMGDGIGVDAADAFAVPVDSDQPELFA